MKRLLDFTTLAGLLVGAATGAVLTPFGIPFGAAAGAVLGLLSGLCTAGLLHAEGPDFTISAARVLLAAPPLILLVLAGTVTALIGGAGGVFLAVVSLVVATPLTAAVTHAATPWAVAKLRPGPADGTARRAMIRAILIPLWFLVFAVVAWVVTFGFLTLQ
ncbi:hypothetical protein GCM10020358_57710 [Amorphoplanes nipponensis]|uniref:Uncharacterized protein n=1 Tax=Actinoplanes nipponensis TaxID=135950 RepID=A0A919JBR8_9ACTN|nr:hypothetical protein [Actinoplanes nipponensis]GIE47803.1 hypothetical protein Ani05nite_13370 [Actinoplanes nipponensis]